MGDGTWAVSDGQGGGFSDSVSLTVEGQGGGSWAVGGQFSDDFGNVNVSFGGGGDVGVGESGSSEKGDGGELHS